MNRRSSLALAPLVALFWLVACAGSTEPTDESGSAVARSTDEKSPAAAQATLEETRGFAALPATRQRALLRLAAQPLNRFSKAFRRDLATLAANPAFDQASGEEQAKRLWALTEAPTDLSVAPDAEGLWPGALPSYGQVLAAIAIPSAGAVRTSVGAPEIRHRLGAPPAKDVDRHVRKLTALKDGRVPSEGLIGAGDFDLTGEDAAFFPVKIGDRTTWVTAPLTGEQAPDTATELHVPASASTGGVSLTGHSVDQIVDALAMLPPATLGLFDQIDLVAGYNPLDPIFAKVYGRPDFHASMLAAIFPIGTFGVFPLPGASAGGIDPNTMVHESGHIWTFKSWGLDPTTTSWVSWREAIAEDALVPSVYATSSVMEDSAETVLVYCATRSMGSAGVALRDEMKALFPRRWAILEAQFPR